MDKLLINQDFFENLTPNLKRQCIKLCRYKKSKDIYDKASLFILLLTGAFFIITFKDILFTSKKYLSLNSTFYYAKCLIIILGGFLLSNSLNKNSKHKYQQIYTALKGSLSGDICTCKVKCRCKDELLIFLKKQGINM